MTKYLVWRENTAGHIEERPLEVEVLTHEEAAEALLEDGELLSPPYTADDQQAEVYELLHPGQGEPDDGDPYADTIHVRREG